MAMGNVSNTVRKGSKVPSLTHPHVKRCLGDWEKWRLTYEAGDAFIRRYLVKFSNRENEKDFQERRRLAYCPAFAKSAVQEIRNAIYKRADDISREGGTDSYQLAVTGKDNGVDLIGSDMNFFMNVKVLDELLPMGRVGIFVDMPRDVGNTLGELQNKRPYIYLYSAEDIRSYTRDETCRPNEFSSVLLMDHDYDLDETTQLPIKECTKYRFLYKKYVEGTGFRVFCRFYNSARFQVDAEGNEYEGDNVEYDVQLGNLQEIPFHLLDLGNSLLADAANYQVVMTNLATNDVWYATRANFPFYIEPFDPKSQSEYIKRQATNDFEANEYDPISVTTTNSTEIVTGPTHGRKYPIGTNQPAFIHPSPEPLKASMAKQDQMKQEIRELVNLSLSGLSASAEAKAMDKEGLQNGLSYIAMTLQHAENRIAHFWALYEGKKEGAEVQYPEQYQLLNPDQVDKEIESLTKLIDRTTSLTLKRRCMKIIAQLKVSSYVNRVELLKIEKEIDNAKVVIADNLSIKNDLEAGLVSVETASIARGYPKDEAKKAAEDHAERLKRIQDAQTPIGGVLPANAQARGIKDLAGDPEAGAKEKAQVKDQTKEPVVTDPTRGQGKDAK